MSELNFQWDEPPKGASEEEIRTQALKRAKDLYENLADFRADAWRYFKTVEYKNYNPDSERGVEKDSMDEVIILENPHLTLNCTSSCVETVQNRIAKMKPKASFLSKDADREKREIARKLDHWILKIFKQGNVWKEGAQAFRSAAVCGLGIVKLYPSEKKKKAQKISVFDFFCSDAYKGTVSYTHLTLPTILLV